MTIPPDCREVTVTVWRDLASRPWHRHRTIVSRPWHAHRQASHGHTATHPAATHHAVSGHAGVARAVPLTHTEIACRPRLVPPYRAFRRLYGAALLGGGLAVAGTVGAYVAGFGGGPGGVWGPGRHEHPPRHIGAPGVMPPPGYPIVIPPPEVPPSGQSPIPTLLPPASGTAPGPHPVPAPEPAGVWTLLVGFLALLCLRRPTKPLS